MKRLLHLPALFASTASLLLCLAFTACEQDTYDKGTGRYSLMQAELVEAFASTTQQLSRVVTDEGVNLVLSQPYEAKWAMTTDSAYRALLYYNKVEDGTAEPVACSQIPTAVILPVDSFKNGVRQDPLRFESAWVSKNGRYLNASIYLMTGADDNKDHYHMLAVVDDSVIVNPNGTRLQRLRLYHNQGGMPEYYSQRTYFSIPLGNIQADSVSISINTYNGMVTRKMKLQ